MLHKSTKTFIISVSLATGRSFLRLNPNLGELDWLNKWSPYIEKLGRIQQSLNSQEIASEVHIYPETDANVGAGALDIYLLHVESHSICKI